MPTCIGEMSGKGRSRRETCMPLLRRWSCFWQGTHEFGCVLDTIQGAVEGMQTINSYQQGVVEPSRYARPHASPTPHHLNEGLVECSLRVTPRLFPSLRAGAGT